MATQRQERGQYIIQAVDNALNVLETLCEFDQDVHVTRLSKRLGLNKSTVFRLLATFQQRGYVEQDQHTQCYRLGLSAFEISQKLLSRMDLLEKARPVMGHLLRDHNETVYFAVRRNSEILFLDMLETTRQVKVISFLGQRFPLAYTAAGRLFLAWQASSPTPLPAGAKHGGKEPSEAELEEIRRHGCCWNREGYAQGISALATPVFDRQELMVGALVILAPEFRLDRNRALGELAAPLLIAAETISSRLGSTRQYLFAKGA